MTRRDDLADDFDDRRRPADDSEIRAGRVDAARRRTAAPGLVIALIGFLSLTLDVAVTTYVTLHPEKLAELMFDKWLIPTLKAQPDTPQREKALADVRQQRNTALAAARQKRGLDPVSLGLNVLGAVPSVLMLVGGLKLRCVGGYGWAMTGCIAAMVPCCNYSVCLSIPFGVWGLVVLLDPAVTAAFRRAG